MQNLFISDTFSLLIFEESTFSSNAIVLEDTKHLLQKRFIVVNKNYKKLSLNIKEFSPFASLI